MPGRVGCGRGSSASRLRPPSGARSGGVGSLVALLAVGLAVAPWRTLRSGAVGRALVPVLVATGRLQLGYAVLLALGLALTPR
jgi:1,4-dihydroxy-2-naphthoate octaprenyltransferase